MSTRVQPTARLPSSNDIIYAESINEKIKNKVKASGIAEVESRIVEIGNFFESAIDVTTGDIYLSQWTLKNREILHGILSHENGHIAISPVVAGISAYYFTLTYDYIKSNFTYEQLGLPKDDEVQLARKVSGIVNMAEDYIVNIGMYILGVKEIKYDYKTVLAMLSIDPVRTTTLPNIAKAVITGIIYYCDNIKGSIDCDRSKLEEVAGKVQSDLMSIKILGASKLFFEPAKEEALKIIETIKRAFDYINRDSEKFYKYYWKPLREYVIVSTVNPGDFSIESYRDRELVREHLQVLDVFTKAFEDVMRSIVKLEIKTEELYRKLPKIPASSKPSNKTMYSRSPPQSSGSSNQGQNQANSSSSQEGKSGQESQGNTSSQRGSTSQGKQDGTGSQGGSQSGSQQGQESQGGTQRKGSRQGSQGGRQGEASRQGGQGGGKCKGSTGASSNSNNGNDNGGTSSQENSASTSTDTTGSTSGSTTRSGEQPGSEGESTSKAGGGARAGSRDKGETGKSTGKSGEKRKGEGGKTGESSDEKGKGGHAGIRGEGARRTTTSKGNKASGAGGDEDFLKKLIDAMNNASPGKGFSMSGDVKISYLTPEDVNLVLLLSRRKGVRRYLRAIEVLSKIYGPAIADYFNKLMKKIIGQVNVEIMMRKRSHEPRPMRTPLWTSPTGEIDDESRLIEDRKPLWDVWKANPNYKIRRDRRHTVPKRVIVAIDESGSTTDKFSDDINIPIHVVEKILALSLISALKGVGGARKIRTIKFSDNVEVSPKDMPTDQGAVSILLWMKKPFQGTNIIDATEEAIKLTTRNDALILITDAEIPEDVAMTVTEKIREALNARKIGFVAVLVINNERTNGYEVLEKELSSYPTALVGIIMPSKGVEEIIKFINKAVTKIVEVYGEK